MSDELRDILGDSTFEELSNITDKVEFEQQIERIRDLTPEDVETITDQVFLLSVPVTGEYALGLIDSMIHAYETDCQSCNAQLAAFVSDFVSSLWMAVLGSMEEADE